MERRVIMHTMLQLSGAKEERQRRQNEVRVLDVQVRLRDGGREDGSEVGGVVAYREKQSEIVCKGWAGKSSAMS